MKLGGVGAPAAASPVPSQPDVLTGSSKGGGGAMSMWMLLLGALSAIRRRWKGLVTMPLLALTHVAHADEHTRAAVDRWYVGAQGLWVRNSANASDMDAHLATQGYATQTDMQGLTRFGFGISGGYRYRHIALDLAYVDLGKITTTIHGTTPLSSQYLRAVSKAHPRSGQGPQVSVLGFLPLSGHWELSGRLGAFRWSDSLATVSRGTGQSDHVDVRSTDMVIGVGVNYTASERWRASLEECRYRLDGENVNVVSLGVRYRIGASRER